MNVHVYEVLVKAFYVSKIEQNERDGYKITLKMRMIEKMRNKRGYFSI